MKKGFFRLFVVFLVLTCSGCGNEADDRDAQNTNILHEPPFENLTDSISRFPQLAPLYSKRAELLSQHDRHDLATTDFKKAWELQPDETNALLLTTNLFLAGKEKDAIRLLKNCQQKFPGQPEFSRRLSEAYLQSGQTEAALQEYNALLAHDSTNFEAWYEKGVILAQQKDTLRAVQALENAYSLQPLQTYGVTLANIYAETKNPKAVVVCDQLIKKDSLQELTDAVFIKGIYFSNTNKQGLALEQFDDCIRRDWKFVEAYIEKGIILFKEDNMDEALKTFALAANVSNTYPDAYYWMGRCFEKIGKKEEARDSYSRALTFDRNFSEAGERLERLK